MARLDMDAYRKMYLKEVEERIMSHKDDVPNFTTRNLSDAIRAEMNRVDEETWEIDVPDNKEQALKEAEARIIETMKLNKDLGVGKTF
jgi:hypothetical protein